MSNTIFILALEVCTISQLFLCICAALIVSYSLRPKILDPFEFQRVKRTSCKLYEHQRVIHTKSNL